MVYERKIAARKQRSMAKRVVMAILDHRLSSCRAELGNEVLPNFSGFQQGSQCVTKQHWHATRSNDRKSRNKMEGLECNLRQNFQVSSGFDELPDMDRLGLYFISVSGDAALSS